MTGVRVSDDDVGFNGSGLAVGQQFAKKRDGAFSEIKALLLLGCGLHLHDPCCRHSRATSEAGGDLPLVGGPKFGLFPIVATSGPSLCHHDGLLQHDPIHRLESLWHQFAPHGLRPIRDLEAEKQSPFRSLPSGWIRGSESLVSLVAERGPAFLGMDLQCAQKSSHQSCDDLSREKKERAGDDGGLLPKA